jgi:hypothetical protein
MLLDEFAPERRPEIASLWLNPPQKGSPLPVRSNFADATINYWHSGSALAAGLHAKDTRLSNGEVFQTFDGDIPVASVDAGPVVVARTLSDGTSKLAVIGFDPVTGPLRFEVTTPLLFADLLGWLAPEGFRSSEYSATPVGVASVSLDPGETRDTIRVTDSSGFTLPFTLRNQTLQFFTDHPAVVHVISRARERVISATLPEVADHEWRPSATVATGVPASVAWRPSAKDLWSYLAVLGGLGLLAEWLLFGRGRLRRSPVIKTPATSNAAPTPSASRERELVSR